MRKLPTIALAMTLLGAAALVAAQNTPVVRYGIDLDLDSYPQKTAKDCLSSVIKAIDAKRVDYLLAHLAEPLFVDKRVKTLNGNFREVVKETNARLGEDPASIKDLRRFLMEGEWEEGDISTSVKSKDVKNRVAFFMKINDRWFLENRQQPAASKK